jgi:hypothetical protein
MANPYSQADQDDADAGQAMRDYAASASVQATAGIGASDVLASINGIASGVQGVAQTFLNAQDMANQFALKREDQSLVRYLKGAEVQKAMIVSDIDLAKQKAALAAALNGGSYNKWMLIIAVVGTIAGIGAYIKSR